VSKIWGRGKNVATRCIETNFAFVGSPSPEFDLIQREMDETKRREGRDEK